ncbi:uncharacterized protein [Mytilus edulis]|uniref:uncharacterized protein n=1 Tax=Mytilus edulis TaxID=6550 RepID=UPI0039F0A06E
MTDMETKTISIALYRFMCFNIVGTENHVKTLRLMNTVRDVMTNNNHYTTITSGSFGEGLEMRGSDLDIMDVAKFIEVDTDRIKPRLNPNLIYLRTETDDLKPCFTQMVVELTGNQFESLLQFCEKLNGTFYLSSTLCKQGFLDNTMNIYGSKIHGPSISDKDGFMDQVLCLHCKQWTSQASKWITRSNNSWPGYNVKQRIINQGVLFVPIGVKGSPKENIEWRISFSVGEKILINTFTHTQLICYALLKILLKDVIATYTDCEDLLCSYFSKTIMFWISEELPQSIWKPENLIPCFMRCVSRLIYCVQYSICLHCFIPENNMFENKIEGGVREILLEKLYILYRYGWRCILFSDQVSNFSVSTWIVQIEPNSLHTIKVAKTLNSKLLCLANIVPIDSKVDTYNFKRGLYQIISCDQSSLKYLYTYYLSLVCGQCAQSVPLNSTRSCNKHQYKQYNSCLCTLLQNIYHDAVSGWLMLASFFYKTKQYNNALHIILYSIAKCTPEKINRFMTMSDTHVRLNDLLVFQRKCMVQMWKIILVDFIIFKENSRLIPYELQMEVEDRPFIISSIVYAYFLMFLCHYHLNNVRQCQDCIHTLQLVIEERYFIENDKNFQYKAYTVLGIVFQLLGDNESARQAFMRSVKIDPDQRYNTSVNRMLLMNLV